MIAKNLLFSRPCSLARQRLRTRPCLFPAQGLVPTNNPGLDGRLLGKTQAKRRPQQTLVSRLWSFRSNVGLHSRQETTLRSRFVSREPPRLSEAEVLERVLFPEQVHGDARVARTRNGCLLYTSDAADE